MSATSQQPVVPDIPVTLLDDWLREDSPDIDAAVEMVRKVRAVGSQVRLAESHLVGYVREQYDLDEIDDDPEILDPNLTSVDD